MEYTLTGNLKLENFKSYSLGVKRFLSTTLEDMEKQMQSAKNLRDIELRKWEDLANNIFLSHHLASHSKAYSSEFAIQIENNFDIVSASNSPYITKIQYNPKHLLSPIAEFAEKEYNTKARFRLDNDIYKKYIDILAENIFKNCASNTQLKELQHLLYLDLLLFGNAFCKREKDTQTGELRHQYISPKDIVIEKEGANIVKFRQEMEMTFTEIEYFFTDEAIPRVKMQYPDIEKPENIFSQRIKVILYAYYCLKDKKTFIVFALDKDKQNNIFLEDRPRIYEFKMFSVMQTKSSLGKNQLYGISIVENHTHRIRDLQIRFFNLQKMLDRVAKPHEIGISNIAFSEALETVYEDGYFDNVEKAQKNSKIKRVFKIEPAMAQVLGGSFKNQITEYQEILSYIDFIKRELQEELYQFKLSLGFSVLQDRARMSEERRKQITATELMQLQSVSAETGYGKFLPIIELVTIETIGEYLNIVIGNFKNELLNFYHESIIEGESKDEVEFINTYLGKDYGQVIFDLYEQVLSREFYVNDELLQKNPFVSLLDQEVQMPESGYVRTIRELKQAIAIIEKDIKESTSIEIRKRKEFELELFTNFYDETIRQFKPVFEEELRKIDFERILNSDTDLPKKIIMQAPKEFLLFILSYHETVKQIEFKLASSEANLINNAQLRNADKYIQETAIVSQVFPEAQQIMEAVIDIPKYMEEKAKAYNLQDLIRSEKEQKAYIEQKQQQALQQQMALQQGQTNSQQPQQ